MLKKAVGYAELKWLKKAIALAFFQGGYNQSQIFPRSSDKYTIPEENKKGVAGFFDIYEIFNTKTQQERMIKKSGSSIQLGIEIGWSKEIAQIFQTSADNFSISQFPC